MNTPVDPGFSATDGGSMEDMEISSCLLVMRLSDVAYEIGEAIKDCEKAGRADLAKELGITNKLCRDQIKLLYLAMENVLAE